MSEWNKVKDGFPKEKGDFIVFYKKENSDDSIMDIGSFYKKGDSILLDFECIGEAEFLEKLLDDRNCPKAPKDGFYDVDGMEFWECSAVTHWTNLPECPKD